MEIDIEVLYAGKVSSRKNGSSGSRSRYHECSNPEPAFGGSGCQGNDTEIESCSIKLCPGKF
jgi:hypothetical protein